MARKKKIRKRRRAETIDGFNLDFRPRKLALTFPLLLANIIFFLFIPLSSLIPTATYEENLGVSLASGPDSSAAGTAVDPGDKKLYEEITPILKGTPMEKMMGDISRRDRIVAAFLVGIALKESKFGLHSPKKDGLDCYNYWGYRGRENPTPSGYSCFDSPSQAVAIVGDRIEAIVRQGARTPRDMVVWKCGYTCEGFDEESVNGWIEDVGLNYYRLNPGKEIAEKD